VHQAEMEISKVFLVLKLNNKAKNDGSGRPLLFIFVANSAFLTRIYANFNTKFHWVNS
jgi:hypothetical protein